MTTSTKPTTIQHTGSHDIEPDALADRSSTFERRVPYPDVLGAGDRQRRASSAMAAPSICAVTRRLS